jgi:hypothetical protein
MADELGLEFSTTAKLESLIAQVESLLLSDFPHRSSEEALNLVLIHFKQNQERLKKASLAKNPNLLANTCATINGRITQVLPLLGLLLRSTNVRNSFEAYFSLDALAKELVGTNAKIVLSSEWEFSPLTYPMNVAMLPGYVLLGMPASESSNSLLLPLAGHELGHSVWLKEELENKYFEHVQNISRQLLLSRWIDYQRIFPEQKSLPATEDTLATMFVSDHLGTIQAYALSQIEEIFCDAVGVYTFGAAFACAFHYLLAPNLGGSRSALEYPTLKDRANYINHFGNLDLAPFGFRDFSQSFFEEDQILNQQYAFLISIADDTAKELAKGIYEEANRIVSLKVSREVLQTSNVNSICLNRSGIAGGSNS